MTAREVLDGIRGRLTAATPGPWEAKPYLVDDDDGRIRVTSPSDSGIYNLADAVTEPDATFIAAAPTDVARLVAAVEGVLARANAWEAAYHIDRTGPGQDVADDIRAAVEAALKERE